MTNHDCYLATGFRNVDSNSDIGKIVACLRFMEGLPSFVTYKNMSVERLYLKPGDIAVDLGCGLGFDIQRLSRVVLPGGKAIGIDDSVKLLEAAKLSFAGIEGVNFEYCDIHKLRLESNSVDGIRVDRALMHVENPQKVISEMVRVLKPGGWLVCAEPDWSTFVIDSDDINVTELVVKRWRDSFRNPFIGRQLLRRIRTEKLQNTWVEGFIILADGLDAVVFLYDIYATVTKIKEMNEKYRIDLDNWLDALNRRDNVEGVTASVTLFLAGGQKAI